MITWLKKLFKKDKVCIVPLVVKHNVFCLKWFDKKLRVHQLYQRYDYFEWVPDTHEIDSQNKYFMRINILKDVKKKTYIKLNSRNFLSNDFYTQVYKFKYKHVKRIRDENNKLIREKSNIPKPPVPPNSRIWVDSDLATKKPMDPKYKNALEELNALVGKKRNDSR